jgi:hypothetical protein
LDVKKRFTEEQIIGFLREAEAGLAAEVLICGLGQCIWYNNYHGGGNMPISSKAGPRANAKKAKRAPNSRLVIAPLPILPWESAAEYQAGLDATLQELGAQTPLQVYLAEKMFECLWWVRRYETQKRDLIVGLMEIRLRQGGAARPDKPDQHVMGVLRAGRMTDPVLKMLMDDKGLSFESLRQSAFSTGASHLLGLDEGIAMQLKMYSGFQASYEHLVTRKLHIQRLELQNQVLSRDLSAIDVQATPAVPHEPESRQP